MANAHVPFVAMFPEILFLVQDENGCFLRVLEIITRSIKPLSMLNLRKDFL